MECILGKNGDELREAAKAGRHEEVDRLIRAGASVDIQDEYGNAALIESSRNGHGSIVDSLLRAGASVDIQDDDGYTALICASSNGHGSIVDSLFRAGASVDIQNKYGNTALIWASSNGHGSIVDSLIQQHRFLYYNGVDPNPLRLSLSTESFAYLVSTSRALCVTTLLADNYVYMDVDSTEELVQMLFAEYYTSDMDP